MGEAAAVGRQVPHAPQRGPADGESVAVVITVELHTIVKERERRAVGDASRRPGRVDHRGVPAVALVGHRLPQARLPLDAERQARLEPTGLDRLALVIVQLQLEDAVGRVRPEPAAGRRRDPGFAQVDRQREERNIQRLEVRQALDRGTELGGRGLQRVAPEVEVGERRRQLGRQASQRVVRQVENCELAAASEVANSGSVESAAVEVEGGCTQAARDRA